MFLNTESINVNDSLSRLWDEYFTCVELIDMQDPLKETYIDFVFENALFENKVNGAHAELLKSLKSSVKSTMKSGIIESGCRVNLMSETQYMMLSNGII